MPDGDNRPKPEKMPDVSSWKLKGIDRTPGSAEFLRGRSAAIQKATQRRGAPMSYGSGKKAE